MPAINFRDVGASVNRIVRLDVMRSQTLFRSGKLDAIDDIALVGSPRTIVNLRAEKDEQRLPTSYVQVACPPSGDRYELGEKGVRKWLKDALCVLADATRPAPVLVHCMAGKDRTGVVIGALLVELGLAPSVVVQEYLLSEGSLEPARFKRLLNTLVSSPLLKDELRRALRARFLTRPA